MIKQQNKEDHVENVPEGRGRRVRPRLWLQLLQTFIRAGAVAAAAAAAAPGVYDLFQLCKARGDYRDSGMILQQVSYKSLSQ